MSTNQQKAVKSSRWGSLLSGAVAGLESRLDTILTDDSEASAKSRAAEQALLEAKAAKAKEDALLNASGNGHLATPARSRPNDRLQERLAKAMAARSGSQAPSEEASPALESSSFIGTDSPRSSFDSRPSLDVTRPEAPAIHTPAADTESRASLDQSGTLLTSRLPINPARHSEDGFSRTSIDVESIPAIEVPVKNVELSVPTKTTAELEDEIVQLRAEKEALDRQKQEDIDTVLERIDALQAKLQYLAKEAVAAAREANGSADSGLEQQIAEKDEKVALLMEEGVNLSKAEMRHLATIRKLNVDVAAERKASAELRKESARLKQAETALNTRLARLEQNDKDNTRKLQQLSKTESELSFLKVELESKQSSITTLKKRLEEADGKLEILQNGTQKASLVADTRRIGDLEEELSNAKVERQLAADRSRAEVQRITRELELQKSSASASEAELRTEITVGHSRCRLIRFPLLTLARISRLRWRRLDYARKRPPLTRLVIPRQRCCARSRPHRHNTLLPPRIGEVSRALSMPV